MTSMPSATAETEHIHCLTVAGGFLALLLLILGVWTSPRGSFVVVMTNPFGPESAAMSVIAEAGGSFVGSGSTTWLTIAHSDSSSFPARLRSAGAFFVFNAGITAICR